MSMDYELWNRVIVKIFGCTCRTGIGQIISINFPFLDWNRVANKKIKTFMKSFKISLTGDTRKMFVCCVRPSTSLTRRVLIGCKPIKISDRSQLNLRKLKMYHIPTCNQDVNQIEREIRSNGAFRSNRQFRSNQTSSHSGLDQTNTNMYCSKIIAQ